MPGSVVCLAGKGGTGPLSPARTIRPAEAQSLRSLRPHHPVRYSLPPSPPAVRHEAELHLRCNLQPI